MDEGVTKDMFCGTIASRVQHMAATKATKYALLPERLQTWHAAVFHGNLGGENKTTHENNCNKS
eukprot:2221936-Amphidinium_carterae.1